MSSADLHRGAGDPEHPGRSDDLDTEREATSGVGTLYRLLDPAFGFFIWAAHFLIVYGGTATACVLGAGSVPEGERWLLQGVQVGVTIAAIVIVIVHAVRTYSRHRIIAGERFLMWITIGHDAIAAIAILWMLFPILMIPACS